DDYHVLASGNLLIAADHVFKQQVEFAISQLTLQLRQWHGLGRGDAEGAFDQQAGALAALIIGERLGDRLEKADFQACTLQGAYQAKADGVEAAAETAGGEKKRMHGNLLSNRGFGQRMGEQLKPEAAKGLRVCYATRACAVFRQLSGVEKLECLQGDLALLVGRHYQYARSAFCLYFASDTAGATLVSGFVELEVEQLEMFQGAFAHRRRVLADTAGEDQTVELRQCA